MNALKKYLGIVWIVLGPAAIALMIWQAIDKVGLAYRNANAIADTLARENAVNAAANTFLQWAIIILIFVPISIGMIIFGKYALAGEYDHLPESSEEITD